MLKPCASFDSLFPGLLGRDRQVKPVGLVSNRRVRQHFQTLRGSRDLPVVHSALRRGKKLRAGQIRRNLTHSEERPRAGQRAALADRS
jgi:hypothetical protein